MTETTQTTRPWRFDTVGARAVMSETVDPMTEAPGGGLTKSVVESRVARLAPMGFMRRWKQVMHTWTRERLLGLGRRSVRFEEIFHEFARIIEIAGDASDVEAALVRQARRTLPACRIELVMGPDPSCDRGDHHAGVDVATGGTAKQWCSHAGLSGQSPLEIPLRCGETFHGWLRVRRGRQ